MSHDNDDIHSLSGAYAIDALDDVERARFEAHLAESPELQDEVASLRAAASELTSLTQTGPPPSLRASLLQEISSIRPAPPLMTSARTAPGLGQVSPTYSSAPSSPPSSLDSRRDERQQRARRALPLGKWLAGVAAGVVLATGGLVWHPWSSDTNRVQVSAVQQVLQAKDAQRVQQTVGTASATVVRSPGLKKAVIVTANMPPAPQGKVYELWLQQGQKMVRAGLMPAGRANTVLLQGDAFTAHAVGITVEPAGGSDQPTSPPLALISFA
jgi:anti-sigma-K factor RskA